MTGPVRDTAAMLAGMDPALIPGQFVFVHAPGRDDLIPQALAMYREGEGLSLVLPLDIARAQGFDCALPMAAITLRVQSALDGVGLTAAVAGALADAGIPANVIAAHHHDHVLVPEGQAQAALAALRRRAAQVQAPVAGQDWSALKYALNASFVPALGADVLALLAPQPGEHILDLGCGDGVLTQRVVQAGARVTGLEPDADMAAAARGRGITVVQQDAHDPFGQGDYDAVFSNAALHWMRDPARVLAHAFAALRPGGRLVAEQGGAGNVAAVVTAINAARAARGYPALAPWDFPSPTTARARLQAAGFVVDSVALIPRPTPLPTGMGGWLATFAGPFLHDVPPPDRAALLDEAATRAAALHDPGEGWRADYVRLRFSAHRPGP
jgi:SAM-dependent methyltransferase